VWKVGKLESFDRGTKYMCHVDDCQRFTLLS
jgi:hypothetical protein